MPSVSPSLHDADRAALLDHEHAARCRPAARSRTAARRTSRSAAAARRPRAGAAAAPPPPAAAAGEQERGRQQLAASSRLEQRAQTLRDALEEAHIGLGEVRPRLARQAAQHVGARVCRSRTGRRCRRGRGRRARRRAWFSDGSSCRVGHDRADPPVEQPLAERVAQRHGRRRRSRPRPRPSGRARGRRGSPTAARRRRRARGRPWPAWRAPGRRGRGRPAVGPRVASDAAAPYRRMGTSLRSPQ